MKSCRLSVVLPFMFCTALLAASDTTSVSSSPSSSGSPTMEYGAVEEPGIFDSASGPGVRPSPREILSAVKRRYPDAVEEVAFRNDDWAVRIRGEWFAWARGRLLPESIRDEWRRYDPVPFYPYPRGLPPVAELSDDEREELDEFVLRREENPARRHPGFFNALWRAHDRDSSWHRVKTTYFLGLKTEIHRELLEDLAAVEEAILAAAENDPELRSFVRSIVKLEGYNWRRIAGSESLSFHSYGTAIDIIPRSYQGKQVYWRWAMEYFPRWYSLPYERRFMPPEAFIKAFESHGFVWGGKWLFFDTIHFEYRPEILDLSGILPR